MIIEEEYGNDYFGNLVIQGYPNLERIVVKKYSLQDLNSLKICNCEKLKSFEVEDLKTNDWVDLQLYGSFTVVKSLSFSSIFL